MKYEITYIHYQCYNIKVITLVSYATIETKLQSAKNLPKTPTKTCQKPR